ncbi:MAG: hypothetical protein HXY39_02990 [Chloroflexi bacterium]|nr:hypothetical protein [Chloroflexota bacterium]
MAVAGWPGAFAGQVFITCALLCLPGLALLLRMAPAAGATALERFTLSVGLSLSLVPLLYLWATMVNIRLSAWLLWLVLLISLLITLVSRGRVSVISAPFVAANAMWYAVIAGCTAITLWLRFEQIRSLAMPVWVDSLHHALLVRVVVEQGTAPFTLRPYLPVDALTYHWGYHVVVAAAAQLAGLHVPRDLPDGLLWMGQIMSTAMAPAYAALAVRLWQRPVAGATAALVVGLASVMPAFYLSWGRYTLLAGMLMLPAVLIAMDEVCRRPGLPSAGLLALLVAGLSLVHVAVFALVLAACVARVLIGPETGQWRRAAGWMVIAIGSALALTAPWVLMLARQALPGTGSSAMHIAGNIHYNALPVELLRAGTNHLLLALAGAGALLALRQRRRAAAWLLGWCALAMVLANPVVIGLPYLSFITNELLTITMFAPLALLIAGGVAAHDARAPQHGWRALAYHAVLVALVLGVALWGVDRWRTIVRADTVLAGAADRAAIEWIARATPPDARFVVGTAGWLFDVDRGVDGGWWILPLAGRQVSTPPVIYNYGAPAAVAAIKRDTAWLRDYGAVATAAQLAAFMRDRGYGYVYTSERPGAIHASTLRGSPLFEEVYAAEGIGIFRLHALAIETKRFTVGVWGKPSGE